MDGVILPPSIVIATSNASALNTIRCLGTQRNSDITIELFDFNGMSQDLETVSYVCLKVAIMATSSLIAPENLPN